MWRDFEVHVSMLLKLSKVTWGLLNFRDSRLLAKPSGRYILVGPGSGSQPELPQALLLIAHAQTGQAEDFHPLSDRPNWVVSWKTSSSKVMWEVNLVKPLVVTCDQRTIGELVLYSKVAFNFQTHGNGKRQRSK